MKLNQTFWDNWYRPYQIFYKILLLGVVVAIALMLASKFYGDNLVLDWELSNDLQPVEFIFDHYQLGMYSFPITSKSYVMQQTYHAEEAGISIWVAYAMLALFALLFCVLLGIATTLSRFYFFIACGLATIIFVIFRFENLLLFEQYQKIGLIISLIIYLLPAYYFHAFKQGFSLTKRILIFIGISILWSGIIYYFSGVEFPYVYLTTYGIIAPLIITILFIFIIGHEIISAFLYITTQSTSEKGQNNLIHFMVLSIAYLGILTLLFLNNERYIDWKMLFIDPFWIFIAATILGIWGYKKRETIYQHLFHFYPQGAFIYLTLAIISMLSIAYFFCTANDAFIDVIEDAIIFSQLGFSLTFILYVISNFYPAMMEGLTVHKIVYKPKTMPYFSARLAGLVGVAAFFILARMMPYYQSYSGYYIGLADLYNLQGEDLLASEYYNLSNAYGNQSHRANLALANIEKEQGDVNKIRQHLAVAVNKNPTEFAFANLAELYSRNNKYFDALFTLRNGIDEFPYSGELANNLGVLLTKTNVLDSAVHFLKRASKGSTEPTANTNLLSIFALKDISIARDSVEYLFHENTSNAEGINLLAMANKQQYFNLDISPKSFKEAKNQSDALVYNYNLLLNKPDIADSAFWKNSLDFYENSNITWMKEELDYAFALASSRMGNNMAAFRILNVLNGSDVYGYGEYEDLVARLLMKNGAYYQAIEHFTEAEPFYSVHLKAEKAMALMEIGDTETARQYWQQIIRGTDDTNLRQLANRMLDVLAFKNNIEVTNAPDLEKYYYLRFNDSLTIDEYEGLALTFDRDEMMAASYIDLAEQYLKIHDPQNAIRVYNKINGVTLPNEYYQKQYLKLSVLLLINTRDAEGLKRLIPKLKEYESLRPYQLLADAARNEIVGFYENAEKQYRELAKTDPFCENCILMASDFFSSGTYDKQESYNILVDAIELNKYSYYLNLEYAKKCLDLGLDSYVNDIYNKLSNTFPKKKFTQFKTTINNYRKELNKEREW